MQWSLSVTLLAQEFVRLQLLVPYKQSTIFYK